VHLPIDNEPKEAFESQNGDRERGVKSTVIRSEIVIVGSGPGGATAAKELASGRKEVLILEKGSSAQQTVLYKNRAGIPFKMLSALKKSLGIHPSAKNISIRSWRGVGGTSTVSSGNVVRGWEERLGALGIDLEEEWQELEQELGISPFPERLIGEGARSLAEAADSLGI
jgi:choline dehydrogenase-like flavoprotein